MNEFYLYVCNWSASKGVRALAYPRARHVYPVLPPLTLGGGFIYGEYGVSQEFQSYTAQTCCIIDDSADIILGLGSTRHTELLNQSFKAGMIYAATCLIWQGKGRGLVCRRLEKGDGLLDTYSET